MEVYMSLRFGIKTAQQHLSYPEILALWQQADAAPAIEHAWIFDHFMPLGAHPEGPCLEGWTLLAALAAQTRRLRLGLLVTGNTYRHPAVLANMAATVDIISGGRLDVGLGAGWYEREHHAYGIPLYPPGERIRRLQEACVMIRRLWKEPVVDFEGKYYQLHQARCEPKPLQQPAPPLLLGGRGEKLMLRVVAEQADIWNSPGDSVELYRHRSQVLDEHCIAIGRDPRTVERSVQLVLNQENPAETRDELREYIAIGATHLVLELRPPLQRDCIQLLVREVIAPLQAEFANESM